MLNTLLSAGRGDLADFYEKVTDCLIERNLLQFSKGLPNLQRLEV